jgi:hypothetical protein
MLGLLANELVQITMAGVITKSVGSLFRVLDDSDAPKAVRANTLKREGILLLLTSVFTAAAERICTQILLPAMQKAFQQVNFAGYRKLLAVVPISVGIFLAESSSRLFFPKAKWEERKPEKPETDHKRPIGPTQSVNVVITAPHSMGRRLDIRDLDALEDASLKAFSDKPQSPFILRHDTPDGLKFSQASSAYASKAFSRTLQPIQRPAGVPAYANRNPYAAFHRTATTPVFRV